MLTLGDTLTLIATLVGVLIIAEIVFEILEARKPFAVARGSSPPPAGLRDELPPLG